MSQLLYAVSFFSPKHYINTDNMTYEYNKVTAQIVFTHDDSEPFWQSWQFRVVMQTRLLKHMQ